MTVIKYIILKSLLLVSLICLGQEKLDIQYITQSGCDGTVDVSRIQNRIIHKTYSNSALEVVIGVVINCAGIHRIEAEIKNDTLYLALKQGFLKYDTIEKQVIEHLNVYNCDCCFEFKIIVDNISIEPICIYLDGKEIKPLAERFKTFPIQFDIINEDTLNFKDIYGLKQGRWNKIDRTDIQIPRNYEIDYFYVDDKVKKGKMKRFYPSGKLKSIRTFTDFGSFYDENFEINGILIVPPPPPSPKIEIDDTSYLKGVAKVVDIQPKYKKGEAAFLAFIEKEMKNPHAEMDIEGTIWLSCIVEKNGQLTHIKVFRDIASSGWNNEAIRLLTLTSGKWACGYVQGKKVRTLMHIPIKCKIQ